MKKIIISAGAALGLLLSLPAWSDRQPDRDHRGGNSHYQDHGRRHDHNQHGGREYGHRHHNRHWYAYDRHQNNWYWRDWGGRRPSYWGRDHDHDRWYYW